MFPRKYCKSNLHLLLNVKSCLKSLIGEGFWGYRRGQADTQLPFWHFNTRSFNTWNRLWNSHWQEYLSRKISRRNDSLFSRSLEKTDFSFLFLFSIFKIFRKKFYFSSRFVRFLKPFSFYSWFSRFLRKNPFSLLDWWDFATQISFSSWFSRFWEKNLFLFSIYEIFDNNSLSLLNFQDFYKQMYLYI